MFLSFIKRILKIIAYTVTAIILLMLGILGANYWIENSTKSYIFDETAAIPANKVGLLLGTNPLVQGGRRNLYFEYRIRAAAALYHAKKIRYIIASGDNHTKSYNEPEAMQAALMQRGVPEKAIYLDYAGFRTLDSVVRCAEIFGQQSFTVISQRFHNQRAIYIAQQKGLQAVGFNAADVQLRYSGIKTMVREYLARVKALLDVHITHKSPKFLGKPIHIPN